MKNTLLKAIIPLTSILSFSTFASDIDLNKIKSDLIKEMDIQMAEINHDFKTNFKAKIKEDIKEDILARMDDTLPEELLSLNSIKAEPIAIKNIQ